jgi:hypothetical protein
LLSIWAQTTAGFLIPHGSRGSGGAKPARAPATAMSLAKISRESRVIVRLCASRPDRRPETCQLERSVASARQPFAATPELVRRVDGSSPSEGSAHRRPDS